MINGVAMEDDLAKLRSHVTTLSIRKKHKTIIDYDEEPELTRKSQKKGPEREEIVEERFCYK